MPGGLPDPGSLDDKLTASPKQLIFSFSVPKYSKEETLVIVDIAPAGAGCELTLTHEGILPEWAERTKEGWTMLLESLTKVL